MGFTSYLKSPKRELEQQEVPDTFLSAEFDGDYGRNNDQDVDIMDDLERILGINDDDDQKLTKSKSSVGQLSWEFVDWVSEFRNGDEEDDEGYEEEEREANLFREPMGKCFFEEEGYNSSYGNDNVGHSNDVELGSVVKREQVGFWDEDYNKVSLNLSLNYDEVLDAWSDRGSLWADDCPLSASTNGYMGEVPVMEEERARREASVMRYKEKRQTRLFSKKIRYEVRKLNADKRPRLKGRFVKRVS